MAARQSCAFATSSGVRIFSGLEAGGLSPDWRVPGDAVWIELVDPTRAEEVAVEQSIGLLLPTREEMAEIEASSRLYQEDGGTFMTATVLVNADGDLPTAAPVTFVLAGQRLVTIRYVEPRAFSVFAAVTVDVQEIAQERASAVAGSHPSRPVSPTTATPDW